jgi:hypothetical protein
MLHFSGREAWPQTNSNDMDGHRQETFQSQQRSGQIMEVSSQSLEFLKDFSKFPEI